MPTKVGIHDFPCCDQQSRGWRAFARHDEEGQAGESTLLAVGISQSEGAARAAFFGLLCLFDDTQCPER
jgi:hypothetical protein